MTLNDRSRPDTERLFSLLINARKRTASTLADTTEPVRVDSAAQSAPAGQH
jgi:hypothetical protein